MVGFLIMCFLPAVIRDVRDFKTITGLAMVIITASAVIGILQHYNILGMQSATLNPHFASQMEGNFRSMGTAESPLIFSYFISVAFTVLLGFFLVKGLNQNLKWQAPLALLLMAGALYFTYTRSSLIAIALAAVAVVLFIKTRINSVLIMLIMMAIAHSS
jgi:hypothetical protein